MIREQEEALMDHMRKYAADGRYSEFLEGNEKQLVDRLGRA